MNLAMIFNLLDATGYSPIKSDNWDQIDRRVIEVAMENVIQKDGVKWFEEVLKDFIYSYANPVKDTRRQRIEIAGIMERQDCWQTHPDYSREDWKYEVENDDTNLGYWDWVRHAIEWED